MSVDNEEAALLHEEATMTIEELLVRYGQNLNAVKHAAAAARYSRNDIHMFYCSRGKGVPEVQCSFPFSSAVQLRRPPPRTQRSQRIKGKMLRRKE